MRPRSGRLWCVAALAATALVCLPSPAAEPLRALIVDGQNNHGNWPTTTRMMRDALERTGLFTVDVVTHAPQGVDPSFRPAFDRYAVVVSNFGHGAAEWPEATRLAFEEYVSGGGGFVVVHAADNSFPEWRAYNEMIGLGGWGGRDERSGPYVYLDDDGRLIRDTSAGPGGSHGRQWAFPVIVRDADHPITRGMPPVWLHAQDELYDRLRGPAVNLRILATARSDVTNRHEPMLMVIEHGRGRVFHTPMGHADESHQCVGFVTALQRGAEWAATGEVTQPIPDDFPTADAVSRRPTAP